MLFCLSGGDIIDRSSLTIWTTKTAPAAKGGERQVSLRTAIDNPDTGLIEYGYDLTGNLRYKVTPNLRLDGKAIEYLYDRDRLVNIRYPNNPQSNVTYTYGDNTPANANVGRVGRITRVDHQSGYEERWYGKLGETVKETKYVHLPGELWHSGQKHNQGKTQPEEYEVFTTEYEYDSFGRLHRLVYPDGEELTYLYHAGGLPRAVLGTYKRNPYAYVSHIGYDEYEQRVHVALGNGAVTDYRYDTRTRRLNTLQTQSQGYRFQDLGYSYDKVGNILGLKNDIDPPASGMGGYVNQTFSYDGLYRLSTASGTYMGDLDSREHYTLSMGYDTIHNITRKNQRHWVESLDGNATKHGTTYDWHYGYNGAQPHAPTNIGELDPISFSIVGRTFSFDANGNQLGWSSDRNATQRSITWDDENRIQAIDDKGKTSQYSYDDAGQRVIKQARQNLTVYVNQYFTERNGSIGSKHIFVGNSRLLTKVTGGTLFIRSFEGVTGAKTPPGQLKNADKGNDAQGSANAAGGTTPGAANGKALGKEKNADKANNGKAQSNDKGNGKSQANPNAQTKSDASAGGSKTAGVNGLEHRSERANEVAQNTCKNKHLRDEYCDSDGNGIPDSQEGGEEGGADGTAPDEVVTIGSNGEQLFYYHSDHLGSTGYVTRENGELHEHIQYFPFGETWVQQGGNTEKSPYLFTSKELDEETGLYYFGARYYDPRTAVWQSVDPIDRFGPHSPTIGLNLFQYGTWNPVAYIDPDGRAEVNYIFIFDSGERPKDNGTSGQTYTGQGYVLNDEGIHGPYAVSTYPNSKSNSNNAANYATVKAKGVTDGGIPYNNASGHKGATKKGLNMGSNVTENGVTSFERTVETTGPNPKQGNKNIMKYANVHSGASDNGNYNSRGSKGCFTVDPDDMSSFMGNFDWNENNSNTGTSHGSVFTYRGDSSEATMMRSVLEGAQKQSQDSQE